MEGQDRLWIGYKRVPFRHWWLWLISVLFMRLLFLLSIYASAFHLLLNTLADRHLLSKHTCLFRWKVKKFPKAGRVMKQPFLSPFILVFHITWLSIATATRKQILPSFGRNTGGSIITIGTGDSCSLLVLENGCSALNQMSDSSKIWTIGCRTLSCSHLGEVDGPG